MTKKFKQVRDQWEASTHADVQEDGHTQSANIKNQLQHIRRSVEALQQIIQPETEYPAWLINELVKSADYLDSASDFLLNKVGKKKKK